MFWFLYRQNFPSMGTGELVDAASLEWEAELRDLLLQQRFAFSFVLLCFTNRVRVYKYLLSGYLIVSFSETAYPPASLAL